MNTLHNSTNTLHNSTNTTHHNTKLKHLDKSLYPHIFVSTDDDNQLHSYDNQPAYYNHVTSYRAYYLHGSLHNILGPAIISISKKQYFIHGVEYSYSQFLHASKLFLFF